MPPVELVSRLVAQAGRNDPWPCARCRSPARRQRRPPGHRRANRPCRRPSPRWKSWVRRAALSDRACAAAAPANGRHSAAAAAAGIAHRRQKNFRRSRPTAAGAGASGTDSVLSYHAALRADDVSANSTAATPAHSIAASATAPTTHRQRLDLPNMPIAQCRGPKAGRSLRSSAWANSQQKMSTRRSSGGYLVGPPHRPILTLRRAFPAYWPRNRFRIPAEAKPSGTRPILA